MAETNAVTSQTLAADLPSAYIRAEVLQIAERDTVFVALAQEIEMPKGEGKVLQANRFARLPLPTQPLSEGVTPIATPLTMESVTAILEQWGLLVSLTDVGVMTAKHPVLEITNQRLGTAGSELLDREGQKTLMGGPSVLFPNGRTARSQLVAGDVMNADLMSQAYATLRSRGAPYYSRGKFAMIVDNFVSQDIQKDQRFIEAHVYRETEALFNSEVGTWRGFRVTESNLIPIIGLLAGASYTATNAAVNGGETGFTSGTTVPVVVTALDPLTGFETSVGAVVSVTTGAAFTVAVTIASGAPTGVYNIYVGLENAVVATLQNQVAHVNGAADTRTYMKAGTPNGSNRFVTQATGPVAPPQPPATGNVHISHLMGKGYFGATKIGPKWDASLTPPVASDSDPLKQRRKAGIKAFFKFLFLNTDFGMRVESLSFFN